MIGSGTTRFGSVLAALALWALPALGQTTLPPISKGTPGFEVAPSTGQAASAQLLFDDGYKQLRAGNPKGALVAFDKAIQAKPDFADAYANRGNTQLELGANDKAIADFTKAIELVGSTGTPKQLAVLHMNRGVGQSRLNRHDRALPDFDTAITLNPTYGTAYINRALSHRARKNFDKASADATKAIEFDSKNANILVIRGYLNTDLGKYPQAIDDFRQALTVDPGNQNAVSGMRHAYRGGKDADEPFKVQLVRTADSACEPTCAEWISIQGRIEQGSASKLKPILREIGQRKVPVFVDTAGGSVDDAMEMGRAIRALGLDVVVTRTEPAVCDKADTACKQRAAKGRSIGHARALGSVCASSCAFLLAAGNKRFVGPGSLVGVHQITSFKTYQQVYREYSVRREIRDGKVVEVDRTLVSETRGAKKTVQAKTEDETYVKIRKYFVEMGVDDTIMSLLIGAPAKGMHWLSGKELSGTRIMTDAIHGEQLLSRGAVPKAGLAAPAAATPALPGTSLPQPKPADSAAPAAAAPVLDLTRSIKRELTRLGCPAGADDSAWNQPVRRAIERHNLLTGQKLKTSAPAQETLDALSARQGVVCPPGCPAGTLEKDGICVGGKKT